jgi:hypothetical protein
MVVASASDPILRVIDPSQLQAVASVPASDLPRIVVGRAGHVVGPGDTANEDVTVLTRPAQLDATGSVGEVRLGFSESHAAHAGTPVQISIVAETHPNAVLIEATRRAARRRRGFVMVVKDDKKAHRQVVTLASPTVSRWKCSAASPRAIASIVKGQNGLPDGADVTIAS